MRRQILTLFAFWKLYSVLAVISAAYLIPLQADAWIGWLFNKDTSYLLWSWANYDGVNYLYIAREGYGPPNFAFFPLFPLSIFLLHTLTRLPLLESGILIANLSLLGALFFIYKLVRLDFSEKIALMTLGLLLSFPFSFFYGAVYTESLFLLLSAGSFYFARKEQWLLSGLFGFFASLLKFVGVLLIIPLLIEFYLQYKKSKQTSGIWFHAFLKHKGYTLLLIPLGLVVYAVYLQIAFGDFLLFQKSQAHWARGDYVIPLQTVYRYIKIFLTTPQNFIYFRAVLEFSFTALYVLLGIYIIRKIRLSYGVFVFLILLFPSVTGTFLSMPRFGLQLFPIFLGLAVLLEKRKILLYLIIILFAVLQIFLLMLFSRGFFIA